MNKSSWLPLWVIPILVFMAIGTVWLRLAIVRTTYAISQSDKMIRNLSQEREQLEVKLASQRSPRHLEQIAKLKFNLRPPTADQVVYLK